MASTVSEGGSAAVHGVVCLTRRDVLASTALGVLAAGAPTFARAAGPQGQLTWAIHVSLAPTWFEPGRHAGFHHAIHGPLRAARRDGDADAGWPRDS